MRTIRRVAPEIPTRFHTLADLRRHTGLKVRTLQAWGDSGAIIAEGDSLHGGKGMRRRYRTAELIIAVLLRHCHEVGIPLGALVRLAGLLRQALAIGPGWVRGTAEDVWRSQGRPPALRRVATYDPREALMRAALHRAVLGEGANYLFLAYNDEVIFAHPFTDAEGPISVNFVEVFEAIAPPRPRIAFLLDLGIVAGLWEEEAA
jgi:DNA-binding transcriptional MerR regulator